MKKILFGVLVNFSIVANSICGTNFFLQPPEEIKNVDCSRSIGMCWCGEQQRYTFIYQKDTGAYIKIECKSFPESIDEKIKSLFKKVNNEDGFLFEYTYGIPPRDQSSYFLFPIKFLLKAWDFLCQYVTKKSSNKDCYCVEERIVVKDKQNVNNMSVEALVHFIKEHNIIFYTGAGLSAAGGVFTMAQLEDALGMANKEVLSEKNALYNPESAAKAFTEFCEAMLHNPPTKAHEDLTKIATYKKCKIVTENMDNLHQRTRIKPYCVVGKEFKQEVKNEWAKDIEAIICCGLSSDDKGFLGWYKKHNPNGIIISIDLFAPNYLGKNDYFVEGDVQKIISQVYDKIR